MKFLIVSFMGRDHLDEESPEKDWWQKMAFRQNLY